MFCFYLRAQLSVVTDDSGSGNYTTYYVRSNVEAELIFADP